jgi:hypothetical protein
MTLGKREKILAWSAAALVALVALQFVVSSLLGPRGDLEKRKETLTAEVARKQNRVNTGAMTAKRLAELRLRSMPSDPSVAQSLYENWLRQLATDVGLSEARITYSGNKAVKGVYTGLRFRLDAKATMGQLTEFLYRFYHAGYLHHIDILTLTPKDNGASLGIQTTIEALSLVGAPTADKLPTVKPDKTLAALDVYRKKIAERNIFAPYSPPAPQGPPAPPRDDSVDALKFAELNGIVWVGNRPQIWINAKTTGKHYELFEGEEAEIGGAKCKVVQIGTRDAQIEVDGKRYLVAYGKSLRDGEILSKEK